VRKTLVLLFAFVTLLGVLSMPAPSEAQGGCWGWFIWYFPDQPDPIQRGAICGLGQGNFSMMCFGELSQCAVPKDCPDCQNTTASHPISLTTGNTFFSETDVRVAGLGGGLTITRTWNSMWPASESASQVGFFGSNWRSTYEERIFQGSDGFVKYSRGDGGFWSFPQGPGTVHLAAPTNVIATLSQNGSQWTVTFQNGEQRIFSFTSGLLTSIVDPNGNTTQVAYDATARLQTVTDPASRQLTFSYTNSSFPRLITKVTYSADTALTVSYSYDTQGRIQKVTEQDGSTLNFAYDSNSLISSITDAQGKVIESHTYDTKGRGKTSSLAAGVNGVTVTYPNE